MFAAITGPPWRVPVGGAANRICTAGSISWIDKTPIIAILLVAVLMAVIPLLAFTRCAAAGETQELDDLTRASRAIMSWVFRAENGFLRRKSGRKPFRARGTFIRWPTWANKFDCMVGCAGGRRSPVDRLVSASPMRLPLLPLAAHRDWPLRDIVKFVFKAR
jgi:hypothetical protein